MDTNQKLAEKILYFFEEEKIYVNPNIKIKDLAKVMNIDKEELKRLFRYEIEYSFEEMLAIFRIHHARSLMMEKEVKYKELWRVSGFKSHKDFELKSQIVVI